MFVSKVISGIPAKIGFKAREHKINKFGEQIEHFGYPYNNETEIAEIEFIRAKLNDKYNVILDENSKKTLPLTPAGIDVDPKELLGIDDNEAYAYKIRIRDKNNPQNIKWEGADTGIKLQNLSKNEWGYRISDSKHWENIENKKGNYSYETTKYADLYDSQGNFKDPYRYTLVTTHGSAPRANGAGYLAMPDTLMPGAKFKGFDDPNTGEIWIDKDAQKEAEQAVRTFSNIMGGNIAGLIQSIPYLKESGYSMLFTTPIANGDDVSSHSYWNKNNMQIASRMGNTENFAYLMRETYRNGMQYVYDGTFTSEGLEGIHFQYALRWAQKNPQTYYWFRMNGLKNSNLGLGVIPENAKKLSHRVINAPFNYEKQADGTYKAVKNLKYDANRETIFQIYDASQVSDDLKKLDGQIRVYDNIIAGNPMAINTHDDTLIAYAFRINPKEYQDRIDTINQLIKSGEKIDLHSENGTILAGQFSSFKIDRKTEGGFVTWDANTDMVKMNYGISGYDIKNLKSITDRASRYHEQLMIERGAREVQDMTIQAGRYWTGMVKDIETLYTAHVVGKKKSAAEINKLAYSNLLPPKAQLSEEELVNILNGEYFFEPKGILDKDSATIKSLMKLPMDALEFGENTVGVLSTSYFSNRATTDETIGKTRFELMEENNPHLIGEYAGVYNKVNSIYVNELKNFADKVISKVNEESAEKLLYSDGSYTEYGEYVIDLIGKDIAKYALLKSLSRDNFRAKVMKNGDLTYDYDKIKEATTLKALGINANSPKEEAEELQRLMLKGLERLNDEDVALISKSVEQRISGTDTMSFRIAEALVKLASNGLAWRLDAAKDVMDQDAVRNRENDFDDIWNSMIKFWKKFVSEVKEQNPSAYIVAEITDVGELLRNTYGAKSVPYDGNTNINDCKFNGDNDAQTKFFIETGITSEAAYSYLFTNLLINFSGEFESGKHNGGEFHDDFKRRVDYLMQTRDPNYMRNLYTFIGNHDKTRNIQGISTDMELFQSPISYSYDKEGHIKFDEERTQRQKVTEVLSGVYSQKDVPIELRLNADNMDYFHTISAKAVSQAKTLMLPIEEDLKNIASDDDIRYLKNAVIDLANGNYKIEKSTKSMTRINITELSTLDNVVREILKNTPDAEILIPEIIDKINSMDLADYQVHLDFDTQEPNKNVGEKNKQYLKEILGQYNDGSNYSLYTVQLARLVKDAYKEINGEDESIKEALKSFINTFNREVVEAHTEKAQRIESKEITRNKDSFGVKPFEKVMEWVVNQAEYKSGKVFENRQEIIDKVVTSITEPAIQKQAIILSYLGGLIGIPTTFAGDEYGMSGYEDKAKNKFLPRNTILRNGVNAERYSEITNGALKSRTNSNLHPLNDGTPYEMDVMASGMTRDGVKKRLAELTKALESSKYSDAEKDAFRNEIHKLSKELAKVSYMMYSANGDAVVTVFSAADINHSNRFDYFDYIAKEYGIDTEEKRKQAFEDGTLYSINPENKYVPIQHSTEMDAIMLGTGIALPVGTIFMNADLRDKTVYTVKEIGGKLGIFTQKEGGKIVMNAKTAMNGVMNLVRKVNFRGHSQFNIAPANAYQINYEKENGKHLSLISV